MRATLDFQGRARFASSSRLQNPGSHASGSTTEWSNVIEGTSCGTGQWCHTGACQTGCWIGSTYYASGTADPSNPCESCQPSQSTTSWSSAEGRSCTGGLTCNSESCCKSQYVPGGSYVRGGSYPATVGNFCMDKYEVTVGRFKQFVAAYNAWTGAPAFTNPAAGAGEHALGAGSGWQTAWSSSLPSSADVFQDTSHLQCNTTYQTWTGGNDNLPINCVSWYEAFAFCIWDGGRLATEAEWEYAAGHGSENRTYPWGNTPEPTNSYAVFNCQWDGSAAGSCAFSDIASVGSAQGGNGYWGQSDLAGNMREWVFDYYGTYPASCSNCAINSGSYRLTRGGSFSNDATVLATSPRGNYGAATNHSYSGGVRCVRTVQ
jgi:sulfatase modifying factor 1